MLNGEAPACRCGWMERPAGVSTSSHIRPGTRRLFTPQSEIRRTGTSNRPFDTGKYGLGQEDFTQPPFPSGRSGVCCSGRNGLYPTRFSGPAHPPGIDQLGGNAFSDTDRRPDHRAGIELGGRGNTTSNGRLHGPAGIFHLQNTGIKIVRT